jgi:hypothetical protein
MYLEQRIEKLEQEIQELKIKLFQQEFIDTRNTWGDTMYNPSITLLSTPDLDTAFASPFDQPTSGGDTLDTIVIGVSSEDYPEYPNIWGSWEEPLNLEGGSK